MGKVVGEDVEADAAWVRCNRVPDRASEELFIVWYHMRVVMVDGQGEGGVGGARVQVGLPVVRVEWVEGRIRWGQSHLLLLPLRPTSPSP